MGKGLAHLSPACSLFPPQSSAPSEPTWLLFPAALGKTLSPGASMLCKVAVYEEETRLTAHSKETPGTQGWSLSAVPTIAAWTVAQGVGVWSCWWAGVQAGSIHECTAPTTAITALTKGADPGLGEMGPKLDSQNCSRYMDSRKGSSLISG